MWLWCSWSGNETDPVCCQTVAWRSHFSSPIPALCRKLPSFWTRHFFPTFVFPMGTLCLKSVLFHVSLSSKSELRVWMLWCTLLSFQQIPWDLQALNWSSKQTHRQGASPWIQAPRTDLPWFVLSGFGIPRSQREGKKQAACPKAEEGERCSCFCPSGKVQREQVGWKWEYVLQVM